ncbi:MAG: four helix bundle protein [Bacteroidetes bacterium]|nr:four helix bundle protein [Bacteroidota bacterium]
MKHIVRKLKIWNEAIDLAVNVYELSSHFPSDERFGLISQTRRASVSISSNIAEGAGRNTNKDFARFLGISNGSSCELMSQLVIAQRLDLVQEYQVAPVLKKIDEIQRMTYSFRQQLLSGTVYKNSKF